MNKPKATQGPHGTGGALLFFYTETPLHVGCGEGLGAVDLPIQRERISDLPVVPGSGIKGALRELFRGKNHGDTLDLFGPEAPDPKKNEGEEPKYAGALTLTDARLLLLPIRTVYGGWAWATSPMLLERLARDLEIAGHSRPLWADLKPPAPTNKDEDRDALALCFADSPAIAPDGALLLEDTLYRTSPAPKEAGAALLRDLEAALPREESYGPTRRRLADQLVLLTDAELKHWARHGTEVMTRVRISEETGTVAKGALWTEESLPSESLLWSLALVSDSRKPREGQNRPRAELLRALDQGLGRRVFLGGDRTIGRGLCGVNLRTLEGGK